MRKYNVSTKKDTNTPIRPHARTPTHPYEYRHIHPRGHDRTHAHASTRPHRHAHTRAHTYARPLRTPAGAHVRRLVFVFVLCWFSIFEIGTVYVVVLSFF